VRQGRFTLDENNGLQGHYVLQERYMVLGRHVLKGPCASGTLCFDGTMSLRDTMCCRDIRCCGRHYVLLRHHVLQRLSCDAGTLCTARTPFRRHVLQGRHLGAMCYKDAMLAPLNGKPSATSTPCRFYRDAM
jgi:hypothetical protein